MLDFERLGRFLVLEEEHEPRVLVPHFIDLRGLVDAGVGLRGLVLAARFALELHGLGRLGISQRVNLLPGEIVLVGDPGHLAPIAGRAPDEAIPRHTLAGDFLVPLDLDRLLRVWVNLLRHLRRITNPGNAAPMDQGTTHDAGHDRVKLVLIDRIGERPLNRVDCDF